MNNKRHIKIVFQGSCSKLTSRGKGSLGYEIGVDGEDKQYIRVSCNEQGGTCSYEWIALSSIEELFLSRDDRTAHFSATLFGKLYSSRSANNSGFLAAILRAEKVIGSVLERPTQLIYLSFAELKTKCSELSGEGLDLVDHVAIEQTKREELKQKRIVDKKVPPASKPTTKKK